MGEKPPRINVERAPDQVSPTRELPFLRHQQAQKM
jgi:hypothetical protein